MFSNLSHLMFSFITGIIAGLFALLILGLIHSVFGYFEAEHLISFLFINEIGEEFVKFTFILFVLNLVIIHKKDYINGLLFSFLVGLGFGIFEIILITFSGGLGQSLGVFLILGIHSITSLFLGVAIISLKYNKNMIIFSFSLFTAVIIHLVYNSFVAGIIHLP